MNPPIRASAMPVNMYCMAIILWSVEKTYFDQKLGSSWWPPWAASCATGAWAIGLLLPPRRRRREGHGRVLRHPGAVLLGRLDDDAPRHERVADAADLGALDVEAPGLGRLEPAGDRAARDHVLLEAEHRDGEGVQHVARDELEVVELADLDVQVVDGLDVVGGAELPVGAGVLEAPGPLLPDDADRRLRGRQRLLDVVPDADGRDDDEDVADEHEQVRDRDPALLALELAGDVLRRDAVALAEAHDQPEEEPLRQHEPEPDQDEDQREDGVDVRRVGRGHRDQAFDHGSRLRG